MKSDRIAFSEYFLTALKEIIAVENTGNRDKAMLYRKLFRQIIDKILAEERQFFSSFYAKLIFFLSAFQISETLTTQLKECNYLLNKIHSLKNYNVTQKQLDNISYTILKLIAEYSDTNIPEEILSLLNITTDIDSLEDREHKGIEYIGKLEAIVLRKIRIEKDKKGDTIFSEILCDSADIGEFTLRLEYFWKDFFKTVYSGALINLFFIKPIAGEANLFRTARESIVVLEPDILYDVTDIAECFQNHGYNYYLHFLKRFTSTLPSTSMMKGNIVNYCFDLLIANNNIDFDTAYQKAISIKPLLLFYIFDKDPQGLKSMKSEVEAHFIRLKEIIKDIAGDKTVEPSFISPYFGFQGRLDLMIEFEDNPKRKDIFELKSGRAPGIEYTIETIDGKIFRTGVWHNNLAQTTCYNLLLDSVYDDRTGNSQLIYSSANEYPIRNAPNLTQKKQEVIDCRNWIVAHERALMLNHYKLFDYINLSKIGSIPKFQEFSAALFQNSYNDASLVEKAYFQEFTSFIIAEQTAAKVGISNGQHNAGFSAFWRDSIQEKTAASTITFGLSIAHDISNFEKLHIWFKRNKHSFAGALRKGDIVIVYQDMQFIEPWRRPLLKGYVKDINSDSILISLRNKITSALLFASNDSNWVIEHDYLDSNSKTLFQSLFEFISSDKSKREILLGRAKPRFDAPQISNIPGLSPLQNELIARALAAKDYFLFQGPPGTGKTSFILKNIVKYLFFQTNENVLLLAYTNRAVDEICVNLDKIDSDFPYIRIGSRFCTDDTKNLLIHLSETTPMRDLYLRMKKTRIFVSTVVSALANPELFALYSFDTVIIDEASQILEPHIIGILSKVKRFIMIGDEKQLPAIVLQDHIKTFSKSEELQSIALHNLSGSLFERLLRNATNNHWNDAFGMLRHQARMHQDIQLFPSKFFYDNKLEVLPNSEWQTALNGTFSVLGRTKIESAIARSRLVFFESVPDNRTKINSFEVDAVIKLCKNIKNIYDEKKKEFTNSTIGIIAPFRAQCGMIYQFMPLDIRELITIDTVERFQGSERDIIIVSFALNHSFMLSNIIAEVNFNGNTVDRKLNVSITRAKKRLIFLGSSNVLKESKVYNNLIKHIKQVNGYFNQEESQLIFNDSE